MRHEDICSECKPWWEKIGEGLLQYVITTITLVGFGLIVWGIGAIFLRR